MAAQVVAASAAKGVAESKTGGLIIGLTVLGVAAFGYFVIYRGIVRPQLCRFNVMNCETKEQKLARKIARFEGFQISFFDPTKITVDAMTAKTLADQVQKAWGFFNDNEEQLYGALKRVSTKRNLAAVSYEYQIRHGVSLPDDINRRTNYAEKMRIYDIISKLQ
jgi:hypothetical protein